MERLAGGTRAAAGAQEPAASVLVAQGPRDLDIPGFRMHPLSDKLAEHWAVWVNGNWRVTFRSIDGDVELVDYQDYH